MNRRPLLVPMLLLGLTISADAADAYNILSLNMGGYWNSPYDQYWGGQDGYGTPGLAGERWYTRIDYQDLGGVDLSQYDVLYVQSGFTDDFVEFAASDALAALQAKSADIEDYVADGGGLVALAEPFPEVGEFTWDWAPVDLRSQGIFHENLVEVVDDAHPVMEHSTDGSLSNWQSSWHGYYTDWDSRLSVLAQTGDYGSGDIRTHQALTLAGSYDDDHCGRMVFTSQDPDFHSYQGFTGAREFIGDALDWASCSRPVPEPSTWALLAAGLAAAAASRRRRPR